MALDGDRRFDPGRVRGFPELRPEDHADADRRRVAARRNWSNKTRIYAARRTDRRSAAAFWTLEKQVLMVAIPAPPTKHRPDVTVDGLHLAERDLDVTVGEDAVEMATEKLGHLVESRESVPAQRPNPRSQEASVRRGSGPPPGSSRNPWPVLVAARPVEPTEDIRNSDGFLRLVTGFGKTSRTGRHPRRAITATGPPPVGPWCSAPPDT